MLVQIFIAFWIIFLFHQFYWRRKNLPPGPVPLPIVGNIFQIDGKNFDKQFLQWKKIYGDIITLWLPSPQIFVLNTEVGHLEKKHFLLISISKLDRFSYLFSGQIRRIGA